MKTIEITSEIVRASFESQFTICEVSESGERDGFEDVTVQHDSTDTANDAKDIDEFMAARAVGTQEMTITINQTANSLDPNATTADPEASLTAYIAELTTALQKELPGCNVEHRDIDDTRSFNLDLGENDADYVEISDTIQRISEEVFETGTFWS